MNRIKEILKEKDMTINDLADILGVNRVTLSSQINKTANVASYERIANALGVPMWQLFASREDVLGSASTYTSKVLCPHCRKEINIELKATK